MLLANGFGDVVTDSLSVDVKKVKNNLKVAMDVGIGQRYLEQLSIGRSDSEFDARIKMILTEDADMSEKAADRLMGWFDEMIGWKLPKEQPVKSPVPKPLEIRSISSEPPKPSPATESQKPPEPVLPTDGQGRKKPSLSLWIILVLLVCVVGYFLYQNNQKKEQLRAMQSIFATQTKENEPTNTPDTVSLAQKGRNAYEAGDYAAALEYLLPAAEAGNARAQFDLGQMYYNGHGVERSDTKAAEYYRKAADQGYDIAQYFLGFMYRYGKGVEQSCTMAMTYYQKAADQGEAFYLHHLGNLYRFGECVEQSYTTALKYYQLGAEQGYDYSQYALGDMYYNGYGVAQSVSKAVEYYQLAADQGLAQAIDMLNKINDNR